MRIRGSNPRRVQRAPGFSTADTERPERKAIMPKTYARVEGVPIKNKDLAALTLAAIDQGFRPEPASNGHAAGTGLVLYPPDPAHRPVRYGVQDSNPGHLANVKAALRAAGFQDGTTTEGEGAQAPAEATTEDTMSKRNTKPRFTEQPTPSEAKSIEVAMEQIPPEERKDFAAVLAHAAAEAAGAPRDVCGLAGMLVGLAFDFAQAREDIMGTDTASKAEVDDALRMVMEAEKERDVALAERDAAIKTADQAAEREAKARADCGSALERARKAEAERDALDAAIRPLRSLLSGT